MGGCLATCRVFIEPSTVGSLHGPVGRWTCADRRVHYASVYYRQVWVELCSAAKIVGGAGPVLSAFKVWSYCWLGASALFLPPVSRAV